MPFQSRDFDLSYSANARRHWINERYPPWTELLTAREVAGLVRRHPCELSALVVIGRFPRKRRFRGLASGWLRSDIEAWLEHQPSRRKTTLAPGHCANVSRSRHCSAISRPSFHAPACHGMRPSLSGRDLCRSLMIAATSRGSHDSPG